LQPATSVHDEWRDDRRCRSDAHFASGEVYHLKNLSDFDGNYVALSAGAAIAGGADAIYWENQHGVVIKLSTTGSSTVQPCGRWRQHALKA